MRSRVLCAESSRSAINVSQRNLCFFHEIRVSSAEFDGLSLQHFPPAASIWFEIWGSWIRVNKISIFQANLRDISIFEGNFTKNFVSPGKFSKKFDFFRQIFKKFRFYRANFWKISIFPAKFSKISIFSEKYFKNLDFFRQF